MFVYEPALLMIGEWYVIIWRFLLSSAGIIFFAGGIFGYFLRPASFWQRVILAAAGLLLIVPSLATDIAGLALGGVAFVSQLLGVRAARVSPTRETTPG
jgi:TRAP-type uncharacterized transport system fused permease subunit